MTNKESYRYWKHRYEAAKDFRDPHWECGEMREHREWCEHMKNAFEALEKVEKYRLHDLRKNPDDLPKVMEPVLLKVQIGDNLYEYETGRRVIGNDNGWTIFGVPVAWKEIEPFEEGE